MPCASFEIHMGSHCFKQFKEHNVGWAKRGESTLFRREGWKESNYGKKRLCGLQYKSCSSQGSLALMHMLRRL